MLQKRLVIIGGKGGVGRTTVSVALGLALSQRGRRTLLSHVRCERCDELLGRLLGCPPVGDRIIEAGENLWVVNMNPRAAIREMGMMVLRFRAVYRAVLENKIVRSFLRAVPALDDYSMIGKAWYHTTELDHQELPRYETVVFDGPATGHLISMLRIPQVILDAVPDGPLTRDARKARDLLCDVDATGMLIVTLAEEMPASECADLYRAASQELDVGVDGLVINQLYPDDFRRSPALLAGLSHLEREPQLQAGLQALVSSAQAIRDRSAINEVYLRQLSETVPVRQLRLPHLFAPQVDRETIQPLVERIGDWLDRSAGSARSDDSGTAGPLGPGDPRSEGGA